MTSSLPEIRSAAKAATSRILASYAVRLLNQASSAKRKANEIVKYAVISTPRVGSTMFCRKLEETGRLGWPVEWINDRYASAMIEEVGAMRADEYLDLIIRGSATENGVFGINFHVHQYRSWKKLGFDILDLRFSKIYWVERRDRFAQAFSFAKGLKTDLWSKEFEIAAGFPDGVQVELSHEDVAAALGAVTQELDSGEDLLAKADRRFYYEDLVVDGCAAAVNAVLADFGQPPSPVVASGLVRQSSDPERNEREQMRRDFPGM